MKGFQSFVQKRTTHFVDGHLKAERMSRAGLGLPQGLPPKLTLSCIMPYTLFLHMESQIDKWA